MTHSRAWLSSAAVASLLFGLNFPDANLAGGRAPLPQEFAVVAADETTGDQRQSEENADESAKMGEKSGTHSGDEGAAREDDTKKVDQSPRQNPTTSN